MSGYNLVFKRRENKYLLTGREFEKVFRLAQSHIKEDCYGMTSVLSIYYDTENYDLIRSSIEKPKYKEKLRLRSYGVPDSGGTVFMELKKKFDGIVYKRRIPIALSRAEAYLNKGENPQIHSQIFNEIDYFVNFYKPSPSIFIAYDRIAFTDIEDENLRITFDSDIRFRKNDLTLSKGDYGKKLFDGSVYLMEIKSPSAIPLWLAYILSENKIFPSSFSKYGKIYENAMFPRL